jgi:hypothetical protein
MKVVLRLIVVRLVSVSPRSMGSLLFMPLLTRSLMARPFMSRPFPTRPPIWGLHTARLVAVLLIMDHSATPLDRALVILLIRINKTLFPVDPVSPFLLTASGLGCSEPSIEFLILLSEDLH